MLPGRTLGNDSGVLTRVSDIRSLSRAEAAKKLPVRVKGVVVWQYLYEGSGFIVNDGEQGIYVGSNIIGNQKEAYSEDVPWADFGPGALVEVEGYTDPGGYAPIIRPTRFRQIGTGPLPEPRRVRLERLISGVEDCQSVEVEGVVQAVSESPDADGVVIRMKVDGYPCEVRVQRGSELKPELLVDARIRVRGALTTIPNLRAEMLQLRLLAMGASDIDILTPAPEPFARPRVALNRLLPFSSQAEPFHRKVTQGVVTYSMPGEFFLQDGESGVRVKPTGPAPPLGEEVEVAGFVEISRTLASLNGAVVRSLGSGKMPAPVRVTPEQILHPEFRQWEKVAEKDYSGRLVSLNGRVLRVDADEDKRTVSLLLASGGETFTAMLHQAPASLAGNPGEWKLNADLELTGVCELNFMEDSSQVTPISISGFRLWLRSPEDVRVLRAAPWWTPLRLQAALFGSGFVILLGLTWIFLLRRLLQRRTRRLEEVMRTHRDVELEYTSAQRERLRLAGDLHDGIKQRLAAASFRVEAALGHLPDSPGTAATQLDSAHNTLLRTQTELEECLWGLHAVAEGPPDFVNLLQHVTDSAEHWPVGVVTIESKGVPRQFSRDVAGSLLLLFQEAASNAMRHGAATEITATVDYGEEAFELSIVDNGTGFDPRNIPGSRAGHFGIDGMKQRMHWLRGTLSITREADGGMKILARLPWGVVPESPVPAI